MHVTCCAACNIFSLRDKLHKNCSKAFRNKQFLYIPVAKESSSPVLLKLVLQGLAADWQVDTDILTLDLQQHVTNGDQCIQNTDNHRVPTPETRTRISPLPPKTSLASTSQARTTTPSPDMAMVSNICDSSAEGLSHLASNRGSVSGNLLKNQRISIRNVQKLLEGTVFIIFHVLSFTYCFFIVECDSKNLLVE